MSNPSQTQGGVLEASTLAILANVPGAIQGLLSASGAVGPHAPGATYLITKAGVAALTLAAPTVGVDDFTVINLISTTAYAHTLTATGLLQTGSASVNVATFAAHAGASIRLMAYNGLWYVLAQNTITFS
jgi:hypothetical protein